MTPDGIIQFLGNMDALWLMMALAGGAFGAMIGANYAFAFTGVSIMLGLGVLAGTGNSVVLDYVAFGPAFGPHVAFAGGAAAAAYAGGKKLLAGGGKDVNTPLAGLGKPDVLIVGALFGAGGYVVERLIQLIPWFGSHTDTVALTVTISAIVARALFGKTPIFHRPTKPEGDSRWLSWQETPGQIATVGVLASAFAAGIAMMVGTYILPLASADESWARMLDNSHVLPFAISAITIFFVAGGLKMPVTHHITITAAFSAMLFWKVSGNGFVGALAGILFGTIAAFGAELWAKLTYYHGDTHIDPPAGIIWVMNTFAVICSLPFA